MPEKVFDQVFRTRGMTSLLYVLGWAATLFIHPWLFLAVMSLTLFMCTREFGLLVKGPENGPADLTQWLHFALIGILCFEYFSGTAGIIPMFLILMAVYLILGIAYLLMYQLRGQTLSLQSYRLLYPGIGILATALIAFPGSFSVFTPMHLLSLLVLIWSNDSYAYIAGKKWGKNPLWARVSPKKTWEGAIGGAAGTLFTAWLWTVVFSDHDLVKMILAAVVVSVFGPLGDLFESMAKRAAGVKDSGNWLPGHGGLLDRLDSLLWVAPAYWSISYLIFG